MEEAVRAHLLSMDGVLVWVDPLRAGKDRSRLDPLLREVAARGVWVSAHPDVILKMGVKEVLYRTRELSWGAQIQTCTLRLTTSMSGSLRIFPAAVYASLNKTVEMEVKASGR